MKEYIFGERNGIYIIDLQKTLKMFKEASKFVQDKRCRRTDDSVCRHQSARRRKRLRRGDALWHVLHNSAARDADQTG